MPLATEFINNTTADAFIPEIWAKEAIYAREKNLVFANLVWRVFEKELKAFGDTVHINTRSHLTTQTKATRTAILYEAVTDANSDITVNTWEYSAIAVETKTKKQTNRDMMDYYAPEQGYTLSLAVDTSLGNYVDGLTNSVGVMGTSLSTTDLRRARQYLDDADVPDSERIIVVSPAQESGFLDTPGMVHEDLKMLHGDRSTAKDRAYVSSWLEFPIYKTTNTEGTNAAGHDNVMMHRQAIALVVQMEATTHVFFDIDYLASKAVVEQLYGSAKLRDDHAVWLKGA